MTKSYETTENHSWPAVLEDIKFAVWNRHDGSSQHHPIVRMKRGAYTGPCRALVEETWTLEPPDDVVPTTGAMDPTGIYYSSPFFTINIPDCLHGQVTLFSALGTNHPIYSSVVNPPQTFPATNVLDWPEKVVYRTVNPYKGGYLSRTVTIYRPTGTSPV